jgi:hypothetical protein
LGKIKSLEMWRTKFRIGLDILSNKIKILELELGVLRIGTQGYIEK